MKVRKRQGWCHEDGGQTRVCVPRCPVWTEDARGLASAAQWNATRHAPGVLFCYNARTCGVEIVDLSRENT